MKFIAFADLYRSAKKKASDKFAEYEKVDSRYHNNDTKNA
jgi:hypothetical protein